MIPQIDCDCSVEFGGDMAEFFQRKTRTARKEHGCCECNDPILPGQRYEYVKGRWDGDFSEYKTCIPCLSIRARFCPNGYYYGGLADALRECLGFDHLTVPEDDDDEE